MNFQILIAFALLVSLANAIEFDYCVADLALPHSGSGYACKDPSKVTADDFSYSGLRDPTNTVNLFKFNASVAWGPLFPALNGMGVSMARADYGIGGASPIHSHRVTEVIIVAEGTLLVGFIDTTNHPFVKTLEKGDMFVFPPSLEHFQVNTGSTPAVAYGAFGGANPGFVAATNSLFYRDLPSEIISKITLLDQAQVEKLKKIFGGTN